MKIFRAYKVEIDPNDKQRTALLRHAGAARWAFNWGLARKIESYKVTKKSPGAIELHRDLNALKGTEIPWMYEVSKCAPQEALRDLDKAFKNFFRRCKQDKGKKGFPRFKSRRRGIGSFRLTGSIHASETHIQLPRLGEIKLKERGYLPTEEIKILSTTVSEKAGRWFVSLQVEIDHDVPKTKEAHALGLDVGISHLGVTSDGQVFENPRALKQGERKIKRLQQSLSRRIKGSSNRKKAQAKLARAHCRVSNIRKDAIHKMTTRIVRSASVLVLEDLNVKGMVKNHRLAKAVSDASMAGIHRQIEYKAAWAGVEIIRAGRFYPSSKTCSGCGVIREHLDLSERIFECPDCGLSIDRDLNAAINLKFLAGSSPVTQFGKACGEKVRPLGSRRGPEEAFSMKQEPDSNTSFAKIA